MIDLVSDHLLAVFVRSRTTFSVTDLRGHQLESRRNKSLPHHLPFLAFGMPVKELLLLQVFLSLIQLGQAVTNMPVSTTSLLVLVKSGRLGGEKPEAHVTLHKVMNLFQLLILCFWTVHTRSFAHYWIGQGLWMLSYCYRLWQEWLSPPQLSLAWLLSQYQPQWYFQVYIMHLCLSLGHQKRKSTHMGNVIVLLLFPQSCFCHQP